MTGKVKWYSKERGYGFVTSTEDGKDYFAHHSEIKDEQKVLFENDEVSFEPEESSKGLQANNIKKL